MTGEQKKLSFMGHIIWENYGESMVNLWIIMVNNGESMDNIYI